MSNRYPRRAVLLSILAVGCSPQSQPGDMEEVHAAESDIPLVVRATAQRICKRMGTGTIGQWAWDQESQDWECELLGLPRKAELDILPDGRFSELELEYSVSEIEERLPDVARTIQSKCRNDSRVVVELSLRDEEHVAPIPELQAAWKLNNVVIEFQCSNGRDYELDARGMLLEDKLDDVE